MPQDGAPPERAFAGFWMGGFEAADHVNGSAVALDLAAASGHIDHLEEDHARAAAAGLCAVRESVGWRLAEPQPGVYDFTRALRIERSARRHGLQVLWTLMHYGLPADLSLHDDAMIELFARFAAAAGRVLGHGGGLPPVFTPINEISFLAWAASMPHLLAPPNNVAAAAGGPDTETSSISGYRVKRRLVRATLAAMAALRRVHPQARFLHVEPMVHVAAPFGQPALAARAAEVAGWQWQAWDLIAGRAEPELGGHPQALDLVGVNHYHSSQWELQTERRLHWHEHDPRRRPLGDLLHAAWQRYGRPLVVAETGHVGEGRAAWLHDVAAQARRTVAQGVPLQGLCLYPLVDRPDWDRPEVWHRCGLWHAGPPPAPRVAEPEYLAALLQWQRAWPGRGGAAQRRPPLLALIGGRHDRWPGRGWQLVSRLAGRWHVVVLEAPRAAHEDGVPRLDLVCAGPQLDVLVPRGAEGLLLQELLQAWWREQGLAPPVLWLGDSSGRPLPALPLRARVRDLGEPVDEREGAAQAPALVASVGEAAPGDVARCPLPDGHDLRRFRAWPVEGWDAHEAALRQAAIGRPRLGCALPSDHGLDLDAVAAVAALRPDWQLVFCFAEPPTRPWPARPNILVQPPTPYRLLPALMAGWQAAWQPLVPGAVAGGGAPGAAECEALGLPWVTAGPGGWLPACAAALRAGRQASHGAAAGDGDWAARADLAHAWLDAWLARADLAPPAIRAGS